MILFRILTLKTHCCLLQASDFVRYIGQLKALYASVNPWVDILNSPWNIYNCSSVLYPQLYDQLERGHIQSILP